MTRKITLYKKLDAITNASEYKKNLETVIEDIEVIPFTNVNTVVYHNGRVEIELEHDFEAYRTDVIQFEESVRILITKRGYKRKPLYEKGL